jgi:predicted DNA-binding transcriptional regulator AlpA
VKSGNSPNDLALSRVRLRQERAAIAVQIAELVARDEQLARQDERLCIEAEAVADLPNLVGAQFLIRDLGMSESGFWRLVNNPGKGFPAAVYLDSDPRWKLHKVRDWSERQHGTGSAKRALAG